MVRRFVLALLGVGLAGLAWTACSDDSGSNCVPSQEVCNGLDDDCDGKTDEGGTTGHLRKACETPCGTGYQTCVDGVWGECDAPQPSDEVCDGVDNDCNGQTDETCECKVGETRPCGDFPEKGICRKGQEACADGHWSGQCEGAVPPAPDDGTDPSRCNGADDDCDGLTDEDCTCTGDATQLCGTDEGECQAGTQTCQNGSWGPCQGAVGPQDETCDGKDNDCDGVTDNGLSKSELDTYDGGRGNDECGEVNGVPIYTDLGQVDEGAGPSTWQAVLYPADDVDWFKIHAEEADHLFWCGTDWGKPQCFWSEFKLTLPDNVSPSDVKIVLHFDDDGQCGGNQHDFDSDANGQWDGQTWTEALMWDGQCGDDDSWDVFVEIRYKNPGQVQPSCYAYDFSFEMGFFDQCEEGCATCNP